MHAEEQRRRKREASKVDEDLRPARASQAVFECKYASRELPRSLGSLARFGCRKGSFSKYALCAEQLLARDVLPSPKSWRIAR